MAANPVTISELSTPALLARNERQRGVSSTGENLFSQHLDQALEVRNPVSGGPSGSLPKMDPFVEAVVEALRHAKAMSGMTLASDSEGVDAVNIQSDWQSPAASFLDRYFQKSQPASSAPIRHSAASGGASSRSAACAGGGKYEAIIQKASQRYGVDADLIRSVIEVESSFDPKAVSPVGAMGMMQLMPGTAKDLGVKNPFNAEENIMGGTAYLSGLLERYNGNVRSTLAAYNWGMGNLERKSMAAMPGETRNYVSRIMGMMDGKEST